MQYTLDIYLIEKSPSALMVVVVARLSHQTASASDKLNPKKYRNTKYKVENTKHKIQNTIIQNQIAAFFWNLRFSPIKSG